MTSPKEKTYFSNLTDFKSLGNLSFDELQDRSIDGEISFADIAMSCMRELCDYRRLLDELHALRSGKEQWDGLELWGEHHEALQPTIDRAWRTNYISPMRWLDLRAFERFLCEFERYCDWRNKVVGPLLDQLERGQLEQPQKEILEKSEVAWQRFLKLKDVGDLMSEGLLDEGACSINLLSKLENAGLGLDELLEISVRKLNAEREKPMSLSLDAQREVEKIAGVTSTKSLGAEYGLAPGTLSKRLRNLRDKGTITDSDPRRFTPDDIEKVRALLDARAKRKGPEK